MIHKKRICTGWPIAVAPRINRKVGAIARSCFHCKIGITNDPNRRWNQAYRREGWRAMHVLYKSSSHEHVCQLERMAVSRFFNRDEVLKFWYYNGVGGGGGRKPTSGPFYLYLVTAPKYARAARRER